MDLKNYCTVESSLNESKMCSILPIFDSTEDPIIYHVCPANNFCAIKRQCTAVVNPEVTMVEKFRYWFENSILPHIELILSYAVYDVKAWYEHLTAKQQKQVKPYLDVLELSAGDVQLFEQLCKERNLDTTTDFTMFVKSEKQLMEDGNRPKNRCISGANACHKMVMGPITWELERLFKYMFPGYCGGKNWEDMENMINEWHANGFDVSLQLDGSGFDRTQHQVLKEIVDFNIYKIASQSVFHVPVELFEKFAFAKTKRINVVNYSKQGRIDCGFVEIEGTVLSGSMDTTLMNTIRMACYNRFVNECLCGLEYGVDYACIAKGDDTVAVYNSLVDLKLVQAQYQRVFFSKNAAPEKEWGNINHGLGQIAKFYHWGPLEDIDFCSVSVFYVPQYNCYRMTRKLDRFLNLTGWTTKIHSNIETYVAKVYTRMLGIMNLKWMQDLPIFRAYNALLLRDVPVDSSKPYSGEIKQLLENAEVFNFNNIKECIMGNIKNKDLISCFDYKLEHIDNMRESRKRNDFYVVEAFYQDLFNKYGITREEADEIERNIFMSQVDTEVGTKILSVAAEKITQHQTTHRSLEEFLNGQ
jgi:hypothetical protein